MDRVWFSADDVSLYVLTQYGRVYRSIDFEKWTPAETLLPPVEHSIVPAVPEADAQTRSAPSDPSIVYAFGQAVWRSIDGGQHWDNLTIYKSRSMVGDGLRDLAISPSDPDDVIIAGNDGVFRSTDGGLSWMSLNGGFPNLPASRLLSLPEGPRGLRVATDPLHAISLPPGEKKAWLPTTADDLQAESEERLGLERTFGLSVTAVSVSGDYIYAGVDGPQLRVSADGGVTWRSTPISGAGSVARIWVDPVDARAALAVLNPSRDDADSKIRVLRTSDGGIFWDDITGNLSSSLVNGVAFDRPSGSAYVATDLGVFFARLNSTSLGVVPNWTPVPGLPQGPVVDVKLDAQGNQLWAMVQALGVFVTLAPHRVDDPRLVSSADWVGRAVAPGDVVTLLGTRADSVRTGDTALPILGSEASDTQIQIPFDIGARVVSIEARTGTIGKTLLPIPVIPAVPTIFVDHDGGPMILDAETGVMLDADHPAKRGSRIQVLAAGLGKVIPEWPAGIPSPSQNEPKVSGTVHAYLDRLPLTVVRAVLAPGYIGMYLVEVVIPEGAAPGPAELFLDVDGAPSNRVRVYIEP